MGLAMVEQRRLYELTATLCNSREKQGDCLSEPKMGRKKILSKIVDIVFLIWIGISIQTDLMN